MQHAGNRTPPAPHRERPRLMRGLRDKVIVVAAGGTGGTGANIGAAASRRLADEGALVVVGDVDADMAAATVADIEAAGGRAHAVVFDASDEASIAGLMQAAVETYGGIDGLFYNAMDMSYAGIGTDSEHDLLTLPLEAWHRTLDVGLTGFLLAARHAIPPMLARGGGGIVATVSGAVYVGEPVRVAYAATKTAMTAVMRHIASAYGRQGIRANTVAPGRVLSLDAAEALTDEARGKLLRMARSDRLGRPTDVGDVVTFLLSDDGAWVSGQIIPVDGGTILGR